MILPQQSKSRNKPKIEYKVSASSFSFNNLVTSHKGCEPVNSNWKLRLLRGILNFVFNFWNGWPSKEDKAGGNLRRNWGKFYLKNLFVFDKFVPVI